jgi:hypothetical protein
MAALIANKGDVLVLRTPENTISTTALQRLRVLFFDQSFSLFLF